jgi:outer membrane immunogenic protein
MKKYLLASVSVAALAAAQPAHAASPMMPAYNWSGWYAGGNAGYSWANSDNQYNDPGFGFENSSSATSFSGSHQLNGFIGGGQIGYNWQPNPYTVFGFETDFQGSAERGSVSSGTDCEGFNGDTGSCLVNQSASIDWFGTVRGRIGWLITPTIMPYVTAGLAYGEVKASGNGVVTSPACTSSPCSWSWSKSQVNVGFAGGFGVEAAFPGSSNWTWKVEYLYLNLGSVGGTGVDPVFGSTYTWSANFTDNIIRGGINYYFH